jgi:hypothetical protein
MFAAFDSCLSAFTDGFGWHPAATTGDRLPIALDEDGPNYLFTKGVSGGDVKQLFRSLWLITVEFIH